MWLGGEAPMSQHSLEGQMKACHGDLGLHCHPLKWPSGVTVCQNIFLGKSRVGGSSDTMSQWAALGTVLLLGDPGGFLGLGETQWPTTL